MDNKSSETDIDLAQKVACQKIEDIIVNEEPKYCSVGHREIEAFALELLSSKKTASGGYRIKIVAWLDITHIIEGKIANSYKDKIAWLVSLNYQFLIVGIEKVA